MDVINRIASLIKQPPHKAHMTDPEIAIVVEVFRTACCLAVVHGYIDFHTFSIHKCFQGLNSPNDVTIPTVEKQNENEEVKTSQQDQKQDQKDKEVINENINVEERAKEDQQQDQKDKEVINENINVEEHAKEDQKQDQKDKEVIQEHINVEEHSIEEHDTSDLCDPPVKKKQKTL